MSSFIFVRHGQSQANAAGIIADSLSPLTEKGIEQARKTGVEVKNLGISLIVTSPYLRAQQTAETIAGELGIDLAHIKIIDELAERGLGSLEDKPKEHDGLWYFTDDTSEGIESRADLLKRMQSCLENIKELSNTQTVLVAGHSISGFYLQQVAAGKTTVDEIDSPALMNNADFVQVEIRE